MTETIWSTDHPITLKEITDARNKPSWDAPVSITDLELIKSSCCIKGKIEGIPDTMYMKTRGSQSFRDKTWEYIMRIEISNKDLELAKSKLRSPFERDWELV